MMELLESSQWLWMNIVQISDEKKLKEILLGTLSTKIKLRCVENCLNPSPNSCTFLPGDKQSILKTNADDKLNKIKKRNLFLEMIENIVGKVENTGYQHFHLFPQCFQKASS